MQKEIEQATEQIAESLVQAKNLMIFTGAGISTLSGISDYNGENGIWTLQKRGETAEINAIHMINAEPNSIHIHIVKLHQMGLLKSLITQNIDNLHKKSGMDDNTLIEIHGNIKTMGCIDCGTKYHSDQVINSSSTVRNLNVKINCPKCEGKLKFDIITFGDPISIPLLNKAKKIAMNTDVCLVLGSTLSINPAAGLAKIVAMRGGDLLIVNKGVTNLDRYARIKIDEDCETIMKDILKKISVRLI